MIIHTQLGDDAFIVGEAHRYRVEDTVAYGVTVSSDWRFFHSSVWRL
jgi:hypothetical protein